MFKSECFHVGSVCSSGPAKAYLAAVRKLREQWADLVVILWKPCVLFDSIVSMSLTCTSGD